MAKAVGDAGLWFLADEENTKNNGVNADLDAAFGFPSEFPYEFGVSSPAGSTETESGDEKEDFFAGLTRRLSQSSLHETRKQLTAVPIKADDVTFSTKTRGLAGSPQSTLSGIGSWSGRSAVSGDGSPNGYSRVPSPSTTPFHENNDPWEVIYAAAGQVARLRINNQVSQFDFQNNRGLLGHPRTNQVQQQVRQKQQCASVWGRQPKPNWLAQQQQLQVQKRGREFGYESVKPQSAWTPLQLHHQNNRVHFSGSGLRVGVPAGSSVKRGCAGTGVFLPRHYETPSESRKGTGCAPVLLPAKVVHALNLNIDDLNATTTQPFFSNTLATDYDALLARRNALLIQQRLSVRREEAANYEVRLPQEWTY